MKTYNLTVKKAIELLNNGDVLTQPGKELNKLYKKEDGTFSWKGISDPRETVLDEKDLDKNFFSGKQWVINL
jgi:hypothetical protein